jgi:DNA-directed RNA polymerase subunit RPC12/RpoP
MIVFKTEMENMPIYCNYCSFRHICKPELNLNPRDTKQIIPFLEYCPLLKIPDPKPEPTLTQHEHDLIQIIKKVYPDAESIVIYDKYDVFYFVTNPQTAKWHYIEDNKWGYCAVGTVDLFDKYKLPTLLLELTENIKAKQYNINDLLSRPIRKEPK